MTDRTLLVPSSSYNAAHERLRNRRIEEVMRRQEMNFNDALRAQWLPACLVSELPAGAVAGVRGFVTDATATTFASSVVGGGTNKVPVYSDGTTWRIG